MRRLLRSAALSLPPLKRLVADRDRWRQRAKRAEAELRKTPYDVREFVPAGHFYSPIPDLAQVRERDTELFDRSVRELPGIDLRPQAQLSLLDTFAEFYREQPFSAQPVAPLRYGFANRFFSYGDGLALYAMLRHTRPARVIEVGSGWSSALALDVNDQFLDRGTEFTFIEPYPDRLHTLLTEGDKQLATLIEKPLHEVDRKIFQGLSAGDLLFIDSTHVSRIGSDVNQLLLDVIPALPAGVLVHIHDVFWPFEYHRSWVYEGRAWNEDYLLRALLVANSSLEIVWFNDYLREHYAAEVTASMPLWAKNTGGSIYLRTTG